MAHLSGIDQAFKNMSVHEISTSPVLEGIPTTLFSGKIISDHTYSTSSSSPVILSSIDEGNMISNAWDLHASNHSNSSSSDWEDWHSYSPSEKVLVVMGEPPARIGFHHHRSLAMSRYYPSYIKDFPHLSLLDSLLSSALRPAFYRIEEKEETPGFACYGELRKRAKSQFSHWVNEVRRPHYPEGFVDDSPSLCPLPIEPNWFEELTSLRFDPPLSQTKLSYSICPLSDSNEAKELLAAFAFLDVNILEEHVPFLNFTWACEVLKFSPDPFPSSHICAFLAHLSTIRMWLKSNTTAHGFNQDLHDYELMHHELSKLHDRVLALQDYTFKLPDTASKQLRKRHNRLSKKFPDREAKFKRKARKMVLQFRPLLAKKIRLDAEVNTRKQEQDFLTFTWERFHTLVTWSFPHYFKIVSTPQDSPRALTV